jgi:hypothetical protein
MPDIRRKASHVGIVGGSGTGKTEYAIRYFTQSRHDRVMIFDHQNEYPDRLKRLCVNTETIDDFVRALESYRIVCYDPSEEYAGDFEGALVDWCAVAWHVARKAHESGYESLVMIDELQKLVTVSNTPREVKTLVQTGRKFGLDTCFVSQQPNRMPNEVREQWTELAAFRLKDISSLESLDNFGLDDAELAKIGSLPDLHYVWRQLNTGEVRDGVLKFS